MGRWTPWWLSSYRSHSLAAQTAGGQIVPPGVCRHTGLCRWTWNHKGEPALRPTNRRSSRWPDQSPASDKGSKTLLVSAPVIPVSLLFLHSNDIPRFTSSSTMIPLRLSVYCLSQMNGTASEVQFLVVFWPLIDHTAIERQLIVFRNF